MKFAGRLIRYMVLLLPACLILLPLFLILVNSFMGAEEARLAFGGIFDNSRFVSLVLMPAEPQGRTYSDLFLYCRRFYSMFWNSVKDMSCIAAGQVVIAIPAAWAFAKLEFPLKKVFYAVYLLLMMLPFQVTMLSNYFVLDKAGLLDTPWAFILPAVFSAFPVFIMTRFFGDIPDEYLEAAEIDGAGLWQMFFYIGIPMAKSGIAAVTVLQILEIWNAIEQPLFFIHDKESLPLSLFFPNLTPDTWGSSFAAALVMMVPPVLVFLCGRNQLEEGISHIGVEK